MIAYRDLHAAHERIRLLEDDVNRKACRIDFLEKRIKRLLSGRWLARLFGLHVDCKHHANCDR